MGELRKESGSKVRGKDGGGRGVEVKEGVEGGEVAAGGGGGEQWEEDEEGVRSRPPNTGEGRRVRERVGTPGTWTGVGREGGLGEEGQGEAGLPAE